MNKFLLICLPKHVIVLQIFYNSERRGEEILKNFTEHALFVNDDEIPMTNLLVGKPSRRADNGFDKPAALA